MGFLKNLIRNAVEDGISKGIRDAVGKAAENIVAPKAEEYANKAAEAIDNAAKEMDSAAEGLNENKEERKEALSSLEQSLNKLSQAAEKYAETMEKTALSQEELAKLWNEKLPGFPVWCFGGTDFWFDDNGCTSDGNKYNIFNADNASAEGLELYILLLKKEGFVRKYSSSDEVLYKEVNGEYYIFGCTEAFNAAPVMSIVLYHTKDRSEISQS